MRRSDSLVVVVWTCDPRIVGATELGSIDLQVRVRFEGPAPPGSIVTVGAMHALLQIWDAAPICPSGRAWVEPARPGPNLRPSRTESWLKVARCDSLNIRRSSRLGARL